jgi:hypothetical protein
MWRNFVGVQEAATTMKCSDDDFRKWVIEQQTTLPNAILTIGLWTYGQNAELQILKWLDELDDDFRKWLDKILNGTRRDFRIFVLRSLNAYYNIYGRKSDAARTKLLRQLKVDEEPDRTDMNDDVRKWLLEQMIKRVVLSARFFIIDEPTTLH